MKQPHPMPGTIDIEDLVATWEAEPGGLVLMQEARQWVAAHLYETDVCLQNLRLRCGLSQAQLAATAGVSTMSIEIMESTGEAPALEVWAKLAAALHVDVKTLRDAFASNKLKATPAAKLV